MAKGNGGTRQSGASRVTTAPSANSIKSFLLSYTPKEQGFTSNEEIDLVSKKLGLDNMSNEQLQDMRNQAVRIYSAAMEKEINYDENGNYAGRSDKYWDYSEGMMSVTAIIDHIRHKKGTPVSML